MRCRRNSRPAQPRSPEPWCSATTRSGRSSTSRWSPAPCSRNAVPSPWQFLPQPICRRASNTRPSSKRCTTRPRRLTASSSAVSPNRDGAHTGGPMLLTLLLLAGAPLGPPPRAAGPSPPEPHRVTILYDAFGPRRDLTRDWGFAALVEYGGKRILFDTGNNADIFAHNVKALGIDLKRLDFVVISHRHGDHTAGLNYLLRVNPKVRIYAPREGFGVFGAALPSTFYRTDSTLPDSMRYFAGSPETELKFGTPWPEAHFTWIDSLTEVAPGVAIISTVSKNPGTLELRELSLVLRTQQGLVLLVGCSHPGIETILEATRAWGDHV